MGQPERGVVVGTLPKGDSEALWARIRDVDLLANTSGDIWKLSCAPASAPAIVAAMEQSFETAYYADWAGGLLWFTGPSGAEFGTALRAALMTHGGGHAQLLCDRAMSKKACRFSSLCRQHKPA